MNAEKRLILKRVRCSVMSNKFQILIIGELKEQGIRKGEFSEAVAKRCKCNPETVLRYLRGTNDTTVEVLEAMLEELGLEIGE